MIDNAVSYYTHLREQGVSNLSAQEHARQRFGVSERDLRERISGRVADPHATKEALAVAKAVLTSQPTSTREAAVQSARALRALYEAITGEAL